ncbi:hypothetical protein [Cellulomonas sp. P5_C5]
MHAHGAPDGLAEELARLFVRYDPLEPWLTESHWDDSSWDKEALRLAGRLTGDMSVGEVRAALLAVLAEPFPGSVVDGGLLRGDHVDALAEACWRLHRSRTQADDL